MARVINTNSPGKRRNAHRRTIAEILRHLSQKRALDPESKDMVAMLVYCLREIESTVEESSRAWEKRGYWKKAVDFQDKWWWASLRARSLERLVKSDSWDELPEAMIALFPHFSDLQINKFTRKPETWRGAWRKLKAELDD